MQAIGNSDSTVSHEAREERGRGRVLGDRMGGSAEGMARKLSRRLNTTELEGPKEDAIASERCSTVRLRLGVVVPYIRKPNVD